jgi:hypothetical protein
MNMIKTSGLAAALLCASALSSQACDITIGMVMELTGPCRRLRSGRREIGGDGIPRSQ